LTDVSIHYYDATEEEWVDLTDYATAFKVHETGIQRVPTAVINLESERSNFDDYLSNPYRLIRIRAKPAASWQDLFFGYVDVPNYKTFTGTGSVERIAMSLDGLHFSARLSQDHVTYDYYAVNSALLPDYGITFRDMLDDILANPDSKDGVRCVTGFEYGTDFEVEAAVNALGIDAVIDGTGNFNNQTLFEAVRLIAEHIGYDGYYYMPSDMSSTKVRLYPYSKASIATLTNPFIGEPVWVGGSLNDIGNIIFVDGGVDSGIPSDADRWTEYGYIKYVPAIWSAIRTGTTPTISDEDNTVFDNKIYRINTKCIKVHTTGSTNATFTVTLDITQIPNVGSIDALNRVTAFVANIRGFWYKESNEMSAYYRMRFYLTDSASNVIMYKAVHSRELFGLIERGYPTFEDKDFNIPMGAGTPIYTSETDNQWNYSTGTTFDWEHVEKLDITFALYEDAPQYGISSGDELGCYIDGVQFVGGQKITQFHTLNPPAVDLASIASYGVHPFKHNDSQITSFEQAQAEAARVLNNLHEPIPTLKVTKLYGTDTYGTTWSTQLYPSNVVTLATVDYRVADVTYNWTSASQRVLASYNLVTKTSPLPAIWTQQETLRLLMK
jgi:hypothetical protein